MVTAGCAFAEALQEGLVRAVRPDTLPWPPVRSPVRSPVRRGAPPDGARPPDPARNVLPSGESEAVLRRFALALPAVLPPADRERPAVTAGLLSFARRVLARAARDEGAPVRSFLPAVADLGPHHLVAAVGLLYESVLLEIATAPPGATGPGGAPLPRALAAVGAVADALRHAGAAFWRGDDGWSESRRIAGRLHDELGSSLAVALYRVELAADQPDAAGNHLEIARRALRAATAENRSLLAGLHRGTRTPPLGEALDAFLADLRVDPDVTVRITGDETLAPERCRRELFLILREILRNCLAHARAERVDVTVRTTRRWVYARVEDDGVGFLARRIRDDDPDDPDAGHGLQCVRERVEDLGGRLRVTSAPGEGARTELHLPLVRS